MINQTPGIFDLDRPVIAAASPRHRARLYGSCAVNALLVMPAALSIGVMLAGPASAQTTITSNSGVALSTYEGVKNFTINAGHEITGDPDGIYGNFSNNWTVTNAGTIDASDANASYGIRFTDGGTVTNLGTIDSSLDADTNEGAFGVYIQNAAGSVSNSGIISAGYAIFLGQGGTVVNSGSILAGYTAIRVRGSTASVINQQEGDIEGAQYGVRAYTGSFSLTNAGTIESVNLSGIGAVNGAEADVSNASTGTIQGPDHGISLSDASNTLVNDGLVTSSSEAVYVGGTYASVTNNATGTLTGNYIGIDSEANTLKVQNSGLISAVNSDYGIDSFGFFSNIDNAASGTIEGPNVGVLLAGTGTISNLGTITGGMYGIDISGAGAYVNNQASGDNSGYISAGSVGVIISGANSTLNNAGTILADNTNQSDAEGVYLGAGGQVNNQAGASILGYTTGVFGTYNVTVHNSGTIDSWGNGDSGAGVELVSGYVSNASSGTIFGGSVGVDFYGSGTIENAGGIGAIDYGVKLMNGGVVTNGSTGYISATGTIRHSGIGVFLAGGTLYNQGTIYGARLGVSLSQYGTVINTGTITSPSSDYESGGLLLEGGGNVTNTAQGLISGYVAVSASGTLALVNAGTINGNVGNGYGFGVVLAGYGSIVNQAGGLIYGVKTGIDVYGYEGSVTLANAGSIKGQQYGIRLYTPASTTLVNTGTIEATGYGSDGTGVLLGAGGYLDNAAGAVIYGHSAGINIAGQPGTVVNEGDIAGGIYAGIVLRAGGTVTNGASGSISGELVGIASFYDAASVVNAGSIYGGAAGVGLSAGTIINMAGGTISGGFLGAGVDNGAVTNATGGVIMGGNLGVTDIFGTITNAAGGMILGGTLGVALGSADTLSTGATSLMNDGTVTGATAGVTVYGAANITNAGLIEGTAGTGIYGTLGAPTISNSGTITGGNFGVSFASGGTIANGATGVISSHANGLYGQDVTVQNAGLVSGTYGVGIFMQGGALTNLAGGTINGGDIGLLLRGGASASNAGLISDSAAVQHDGVELASGAALRNLAGGTITGGTGVLIDGDNGTLFNAGTIIGTDGNAIAVGPNIDPAQITLTTGSTEIGTIDGGGTDGQIFLTGNNTLTNTIADFGAGSALDIAPGADWTATGDWTVANVTNDGTFQPGVIGTALTLHGNFTQSATGVLEVVVTPKVTSQLIVDGLVKLAGNLTYAFAPGTYVAGKQTFLTATQGITGGFSTVNYFGDVPAALRHATSAVATAADLALSTPDVGPTPPPTPPAPPGPPAPPMLVAPADGALYADAAQAAAMAAQESGADLLTHATAQAGGDHAAACAAAAGVAQANAGTSGASMAARITTAVASAFCGAGGWVAATGTTMTLDGAGGAAGYHTQSGGVLAGMDAPVRGTQARLGVAVGYDNAVLKDTAGGKVDVGTTRIGLYGTQMLGRFTLAGDFMVGLGNDTASRPTGIGPARARVSGTDYAGGVQISTGMVYRGLSLRPSAGIRIASATDAAFAETGRGIVADFAVTGDKMSQTSIQPYATLDVSRRFLTRNFVTITPSVSVGYVVEAGSLGKATTLTAPDGTRFTASSPRLDGSAAQLGAGITAGKGNWSLYAHYTAYVAGNWSAQAGEAGLQVRL